GFFYARDLGLGMGRICLDKGCMEE
ncbi:hypothetical protein SAMN04489856_107208, partial [Oleiphilus messinensis]